MKKLFDLQLILGFIGFMLTTFSFKDNPTFCNFMAILLFVGFMWIGFFKSFEEDKQCEK